MAKGHVNRLLGYLHRVAAVTSADECTDGQLLQRFTTHRDEAAFQTLMQRHGPMVMAVSQRALQDVQEAEDAFQATFLVLARKAGSIGNQASLASWLYKVAYHIAIHARARAAKQQAREREVAKMSAAAPANSDGSGTELRQVLDEELRQLPEKYRAPLVLCYLEGKSHEQAARELCWPTGSMSRRLARAQELLHSRLVRRGVALGGIFLADAITRQAAQAAVATPLIHSTSQAALAIAAGKTTAASIASAKVAALADEALRAMTIVKLKIAAAVLLSIGLVSAGAAAWLGPATYRPAVSGLAGNASEAGQWGDAVQGVRLRCSADRTSYRWDKDLVRVTFALQNVSSGPEALTLMRDGQELTDVALVGPDGKHHKVAGQHRPLQSLRSWNVNLAPSAVERVSMIFDPAEVDGGLPPGRYRLRGIFRRQSAPDSPATPMESNETSIILSENGAADLWPAGEPVASCSLSLLRIDERNEWRAGDPPVPFAVVLNRLNADVRTLRFLSANRIAMYYQLEITGPTGLRFLPLQPAAAAGVEPRTDPFAYARLMYSQLDRIPVGKSLGERIHWDPSGQALRGGYRLEPLINAPPLAAAGTYKVRAIYQLSERDQKAYGHDPAAIRLVSNTVEVVVRD
jgi:RNA polymerase sigma factor (sigma-70 family)